VQTPGCPTSRYADQLDRTTPAMLLRKPVSTYARSEESNFDQPDASLHHPNVACALVHREHYLIACHRDFPIPRRHA
jgi:hypothetical protein